MLDLLFDGWVTDTRAGRHSLMIATDAQTVADLNARARGHRVVAGEVAGAGVAAAEGSTVGVGDVVVTRLNVRAMSTGRSWVKNGDEWIVRDARDDGSLLVTRAGTGESATLSADYVGKHVELGYASTAHRAQGRTSDTAHAYITDAITREPLYVMATRGRESNNLYVGTPYDPNGDTHPASTADGDPVDVLRAAIEKPGADQSANEVLRAEVRARSRQQLLHPDHISGLDGAGITR
jgi:ATP-dependent exoDNAse (exonuclease V) alpha subunit